MKLWWVVNWNIPLRGWLQKSCFLICWCHIVLTHAMCFCLNFKILTILIKNNEIVIDCSLKHTPPRMIAKVWLLDVSVLRCLDACYVFFLKFQDFDNFNQKWWNCDRLLTETYPSEDDCKNQVSWFVGATFSWHMLSVFA